jgi:transposase
MRVRDPRDLPPRAQLLQSPDDLDARFGTKRETSWVGYRVHLTETCDADTPPLITQVATVPAPTADVAMTDVIEADLAERALLPAAHLLDAGSGSAEHLVASATKHQIELVGPVLLDTSWQAAAAEGFAISCFTIAWEARTVTCPAGKVSRSWSEAQRDAYPFYQVKFSKTDCRACPVRNRCTRCATGPRHLALRPREEHEAVQAARQRQTTEEFAGR